MPYGIYMPNTVLAKRGLTFSLMQKTLPTRKIITKYTDTVYRDSISPVAFVSKYDLWKFKWLQERVSCSHSLKLQLCVNTKKKFARDAQSGSNVNADQ